MTHTLHRRGSEGSLRKDYVLLCMAAKGINEKGSEEKMREFLKINLRHNPVNIGDMRTGNMYNIPVDQIIEKITSTSIVHGVFIDQETVTKVLKDLKEADLGMSVVVSGPFNCVGEMCKAVGLTPHSVDYSGGIWGRSDRLPPDDILEITTMCGHAMVASSLVTSLADEMKSGKKSAKEAGKELAKVCECGIFNPTRAAALLKEMASK
jgi:hypothetical protein